MLTIDKLKAFGANAHEGLSRCLNNEDFYLKLVNKAVSDAGFERLKTAIESGDYNEAFEAAHGLKGILGNLSLTPIYEPTAKMTELLRGGNDTDYAPLLNEIITARETLIKLCEE